jgi:pimeloyl-ACP methyl ester carboxylesterase
VTVPALYMAGDRDLVVAFRGMDQLIPNLTKFVPQLRETIMLPGCGHWTQQERRGRSTPLSSIFSEVCKQGTVASLLRRLEVAAVLNSARSGE